MMPRHSARFAAIGLLFVILLPGPAAAQTDGKLFAAEKSGRVGLGSGKGAATAVTATGQFTTGQVGKPARLFITAKVRPGWHIYSTTQKPGGPLRTKIRLKDSSDFRVLGDFHASPPPERKTQPEAFKDLIVETHEGTVTWHAPIEMAPGVDPARVKIEGTVLAQPCDANSCFPPESYAFTAMAGPEPALAETGLAPGPGPSQTEEVSTAFNPEELKKNIQQQGDEQSVAVILLAGFLGGLILNLMPCVLPVIGLKVLSFVEQSGHDRKTALMLNIWYSAGLLAVFWVLAILAVTAKLGWGQLFQYPAFNVVMVSLVFTMALGFLGVWEFPIPGFVGRGTAMELAEQEGFVGAFSKGIVTTLLATPCTGPFLGTALTLLLRQSPAVVFAAFTSMGLGMATPYLVIGTFPEIVRFLPKPGAWMDTFKQVMGFVLLATVVYLFTFLETSYLVPTVGLIFGLWFACWWVARTPGTAEAAARGRAWLQAAAFVGVAWVLMFPGIGNLLPQRYRDTWWAFSGLHDIMIARLDQGQKSDWQPFTSRVEFERLVASGRTVLVDFTADWCATCKTLEALYLNDAEVRETARRNGVVKLKADWTHGDPEVTAMLELLGAKQVPVIAIFPAGDPNHPIRFLDGYTKASILEALKKAGPSRAGLGASAARG
jgi:suppressor for copper-sensitivity B